LEERGLPAVVCYGDRGAPGLIPYLANFPPRWEAFLLVPGQGEPVLWVQLYNHLPDARRLSIFPDTRWGGQDSLQSLSTELQRRGLARAKLGLAGLLPYQRYAALQRALPQAAWTDLGRELVRLRWVKSAEEIDCLRRAAALTDLAVSALAAGARPGLRETGLAGLMRAAVQDRGGELDLCYLASTPMDRPAACVPAQNPGDRRLQDGDVIITEIGAAVAGYAGHGYAGQIHRPLAVGRPPDPAYQALFAVALEAYQRVAAAIRPGATEQDVLDAAEVIHARGYTIYDDLVHGFGGGYLAPVLRTRRTAHGEVEPFVFQQNMCVVVQPNVITADERMGLQLGGLHLVTASGLESLQRSPLEFICVQ
jgi:Xaa-Pro aminopeptidase